MQPGETFFEVELSDDDHAKIVADGGELITKISDGTKFRILPEGEQDGHIWRHRVIELSTVN